MTTPIEPGAAVTGAYSRPLLQVEDLRMYFPITTATSAT